MPPEPTLPPVALFAPPPPEPTRPPEALFGAPPVPWLPPLAPLAAPPLPIPPDPLCPPAGAPPLAPPDGGPADEQPVTNVAITTARPARLRQVPVPTMSRWYHRSATVQFAVGRTRKM